MEKIDVFEARKEGYYHFRIPTLVVTRKGTVLAFAEARTGDGGDWDMNDVVLKRSFNNGITWGSLQLIVNGPGQGGTISNWVAITERERDIIHSLYCVNYERCYYTMSLDEGATFSEPVEITYAFEGFRAKYDWKVIATGPGHGIQLRNGRLVLPVWLSLSLDESRHRPSVASVIYSDDHGRTWQSGDIVPDAIENLNEAALVELADGSVYINMRNEETLPHYRRAYSISADGAHHWSMPQFDNQLEEPICFGSLLRLSGMEAGERSCIIFVNPANLDVPFRWKQNKMRRDLTVKLSYDECLSWPVRKLLEAGDAEYSDLALAPDGSILCLYSRDFISNGADPKYMTLARFDLNWIEEQ